ncbi:MAG: hypothetical protein HON47_03265 [Candidatus Diapherotrites archaeon]|jgi:hypothetical protein|uniref:Uncharacterized protein n=1 Tax=Candidatus Iainarchaeum sp. TaxID=3101447 RepID=A0A8T5GGC9_9ARCH|nr:hypothetical protein [Candidatus Diapherotrites archaeon]MBT7241312.1 hypothetical protein [Candidatus Diapherotrites archaeon]
MRQRKPFVRQVREAYSLREAEAIKHQESLFFNEKGRSWLQRNIRLLGRGQYLSRKWAVRTPRVKVKAHHLSTGRPALQAVRNMVAFATKIQLMEVANKTAVRFYNKQTADDIVAGKPIPTFKGPKRGIVGCQTYAATLVALLRAATPASGKISNVRAVRTISPHTRGKDGRVLGMPHTIVSFTINGERYVADAFKRGYSFFGSSYIGKRERTLMKVSEIEEQVNQLKAQGSWKESLDPADFGIDTFEKYVNESKKSGKGLATQTDFEAFLKELK